MDFSPPLTFEHTCPMALFDAPGYRGPASANFDGKRFRNQAPTSHAGPRELWKWLKTRDRGAWERRSTEPGLPPPERVHGDQCRVTFVGHATLLVQLDGLNLLTDPVWGERTSPVSFAGPKRFRDPGLRLEDLPPIDLVLISHNHYDHLCLPTLRRLRERHDFQVVTGLGNRALLAKHGLGEAKELDWWEHTEAAGVRVHATPMQHFSGRGLGDRDKTLWCGLHVEHPSGDVLFVGDTGYGNHFREIRQRLGAPRLALMPIGAFRPVWFMNRVHVTPEQAVQAHLDLEAQTSVAMHYGTFALADDGQDEPLDELQIAREKLGVSEESFRALEHGVGALMP